MMVSVAALTQLLRTEHLLIMPRNASSASLAMLTPHRHSIHASRAEVLVVEFPKAEKLVDNGLLLTPTIQLRHIPWIFDHTVDVKV